MEFYCDLFYCKVNFGERRCSGGGGRVARRWEKMKLSNKHRGKACVLGR